MRKKLFMVKISLILIFILLCGAFLVVQNRKYTKEDEANEVYNRKKYNIEVIYERIGIEKGFYKFNMINSENEKIYELFNNYIYLDEETVLFYKENLGIYTLDEKGTQEKMILKDYSYIDKGKRIGNEIIFLASNKKKEKMFCKYNFVTKKIEAEKVSISNEDEIYDVNFTDENSFFYTKDVKSDNFLSTKVYSYSIKDNKTFELKKANIVTPVSSNDKVKTAYIKKDSSTYNLYIYDSLLKKDRKVSSVGGVVKGSIVFSPSDKYIICITLDNEHRSNLNIIDIEKNKSYSFENVYQGIFSSNGESIVVSSYDSDKNLQHIEVIDIETLERKKLYSFNESGSFSKSINLIEANIR